MFRTGQTLLVLALVIVLGTIAVLGAAACSALPASVRQGLATAIAAPTSTPAPAPSLAATPRAKATTALGSANANPLAQLKRFGLQGGVVTSNNGNGLALRIGQASEQLELAATTLIVVPGQASAKPSDIQVGDRVIAKLPNGGTNSSAQFVLDFPQGYNPANIAAGVVEARPTAAAFTLRERGGSHTVAPSATTLVVDMTGDQPVIGKLTDLRRGSGALVVGTPSGDTLDAQVIVILDTTGLKSNGKSAATPTPTP